MSPADRERDAASEVCGRGTQPAAEGVERAPQAQEAGQRFSVTPHTGRQYQDCI